MDKSIKMGLFGVAFVALIVLVIVMVVFVLNKDDDKNVDNSVKKFDTDDKTDVIDHSKDSFALTFLKMIQKKENIIYSPLSIKYALYMLNEGASGNTKKQILDVIGNNNLSKYQNIDKVLSLANAIYIRDTYQKYVKEGYINSLTNKYNAEVKYDAFISANNINNWISEKTFQQIENMLNDEAVTNPNNVMMLVNALAIDMAWMQPFNDNFTYGRDFYLSDGNKVSATMMKQETKSDSASYYMDDNITALSMDLEKYEDTQMEFVAIMPNGNLDGYIDSFTMDDLNKITDNLIPATSPKKGLEVYIPKFSFDYDMNLNDYLYKLGITEIFSNTADFSNIITDDAKEDIPFKVSAIKHKANIDFSEKGVKAAAVTVIMIDGAFFSPDEEKPVVINFNKPFMYFIRDKKTKEIWFVGSLYNPNLWNNDRSEYGY